MRIISNRYQIREVSSTPGSDVFGLFEVRLGRETKGHLIVSRAVLIRRTLAVPPNDLEVQNKDGI